MKLNTEYLEARSFFLPTIENVNLVLIGCGGTGSWLAPAVVRYARLLVEKFDRDVKITFVDPDVVERKNVYRQNFCEAEVGRNKADALAFRYGLAWGMEICAVTKPFTAGLDLLDVRGWRGQILTVLIGCVDNTAARREIARKAERARGHNETVLWLDSGNKKTVGQVLIGCGEKSRENPVLFDGLCTWLPLPSAQHPDLVAADDLVSVPDDEAGLSCAELAMRGSQSLSINGRMAAAAGEMLGKLLLTNDLEYYAVYIDQATGEERKFITTDAIIRFEAAHRAPNEHL